MKRLIICDTHYQVIVALQMALTLFTNDETDIWISDHSINASIVVNNINRIKVINNAKLICSKKTVYPKNKLEKLKNLIKYGFGSGEYNNIDNYDEVLFYSTSLIICSLSNIYKKRKHKVKWSRFEEGLFSYETDFSVGNSVKVVENINGLLGSEKISQQVLNYYCFFPELKKENIYNYNIVGIPSLKTNLQQIKSVLKQVYDLEGFNYKEKYIFFASSSDIDGKPYGETEFICRLADKLGRENFIVKTHPRDSRHIYEEKGVSLLSSSWIPWEVYQICVDMSDKVLLTVDSGSFISSSAMLDDSLNAFFLFQCIDRKDEFYIMREKNIRYIIDGLHSINKCLSINVLKSIDSIVGYTHEQ